MGSYLKSYNNGKCRLFHGDCMELMNDIPTQSIDMICADLPYGVINRANIETSYHNYYPTYEECLEEGIKAVLENL